MDMPHRAHLAALPALVALSLCTACGSSRVVRRDQSGGTIALEGQREEAMKQARQLMLEHCRGPYQIVEEGETVVGQTIAASQETYVAEDGTEVTEAGETTRNETEWRIRYVCGGPRARQPRPAPDEPALRGEPPRKDAGEGDSSVGSPRGLHAPTDRAPDDGYQIPDEEDAPVEGQDDSPHGNGAQQP